jgi:DNA-binding HxlR family transcriptional regulator
MPATISPPRAAKSVPSSAGSPDEDLDREFSEFRESAVRLVERVTDLVGPSGDPVAAAQADLKIVRSIFGKWSADILISLHAVPSIGFEELRRSMPGISPRVLSMKLKELEQNGMVQREIIDTRPPRVRYSLTQRGWTVAWLSQPVFLFLRLTDRGPRAKGGDTESPATLGR